MVIVLAIIALLALLIGPNIWVKRVLKKHSRERKDLPGTGSELANHLIKRFELTDVSLETTEKGDHYDPTSKTIRLTESVYQGKSLTAIATAAHEFGHALQHHKAYRPLLTRTAMAKQAYYVQNAASIALLMIPFLSMIPGLAVFARIVLIFVIGSMFFSAIIHLVTLPVEFDASFGRALPILQQGDYVDQRDYSTVRKILLACALTYVSQAMIGVLNFGRWIRLLKR
ncbi:zinc metallopeptidase [Reinekea marina]|uniref:Zinc metallopeptidase n=1 Tax=Reinekea marina TaxID=1310421 RepID=A0ABV7WRW9_9GAMM|nr:zinc metallopeptidase [Reinekea marina]MDN3650606.1 zinc metallopeptidase [Reinekea marina]